MKAKGRVVAIDYGTFKTAAYQRTGDGGAERLELDGMPGEPYLRSAWDPGAQQSQRRLGAKVVRDAKVHLTRHEPALDEDVRSAIVGVLREVREAAAITEKDEVVLGCPAAWQLAQRSMLVELAAEAGLPVGLTDVLDEPVAAGVEWLSGEVDFVGSLLVADFGGGTCDFAVLQVRPDRPRYRVLSATGTVGWAGSDLDRLLARAHGLDPDDAAMLDQVRLAKEGKQSGVEIDPDKHRTIAQDLVASLVGDSAVGAWATTADWRDHNVGKLREVVQKALLCAREDAYTHLGDHPATTPWLPSRSRARRLDITDLPGSGEATGGRDRRVVLLTGGGSNDPFLREAMQSTFRAEAGRPDVEVIFAAVGFQDPVEASVAVARGLASPDVRDEVSVYFPRQEIWVDAGTEEEVVVEAFDPYIRPEAWDGDWFRPGLEVVFTRSLELRPAGADESRRKGLDVPPPTKLLVRRVNRKVGDDSLNPFPDGVIRAGGKAKFYADGSAFVQLADFTEIELDTSIA